MLGKLLSYVRQHHVALLALSVALGGSAYAASDARRPADPRLHACVKRVGGAMRMVSVRTRCLRTERKVSWNRRGIRGLRGLTGAPGRDGAPGQNGAPGAPGQNGATNVVVRNGPLEANETRVSCQPGERAVGGGAGGGDFFTYLTSSIPANIDANGTPTGWFAQAARPIGGTAMVSARVICASP